MIRQMCFSRRRSFLWQLRTRQIALGERTQVMAILNLTPDSFSGDGLGTGERAVAAAIEAADAGADILDLGAESTRPGATPLSAAEEIERLMPVLEAVHRARPEAVLSVDTYHAQTAVAAANAGAEIINDVSGLLWDCDMAEALVATRCGLVLMHTRGRSWEWKSQPRLSPDRVLPTVRDGLREQLAFAQAAGIGADRVVLDPGFGFGKIGTENFSLLAGFSELGVLGQPLLAGMSRKGFLGEVVAGLHATETPVASARGNATVAANTAAILAGAHVVRVHDVQAARAAAAVADAVLESSESWVSYMANSPVT